MRACANSQRSKYPCRSVSIHFLDLRSYFLCEWTWRVLLSSFCWGNVQLSFQGWRLQSLPELPVPLLDCLYGENVAFHMQPEHLLPQFMPIVHLPPTRHSCKEPGSISSINSLLALGGCSYMPPKPSLLQDGAAPALSLTAPQGEWSSSSCPGDPLLTSLCYINFIGFPKLGGVL